MEFDYDGTTIPDGYQQIDDPNEYSTEEKIIGKWIDGKPIYRKVIDFGSLPNNTAKTVSHGITNLDKVILISGYCSAPNSTSFFPIPLQYKGVDSNYNVEINVTTDYVRMSSSSDRSNYSATVILEYTKTTD